MKKVFVYTEVQAAVPFEAVPWQTMNPQLLQVEGLVRKTWLSGIGSHSVGGLYEFNSLENAQKFAWEIFPAEARALGASFTTRLFDGDVVEEASRGMRSPHYA